MKKLIKKVIKKNNYYSNWWWCLILIVAFFYRGWLINELPRGMNRDEAAIAYNAWLLAETGKDEWERVYPIILESFGDNRLPGYPYAVTLLYKFLPVNNLVARLPSIFSGLAIVVLTYVILKKIYGKKVGLIASFLVAVNPIFIWYSRGAWEVNLSLLLVLLIIWLIASVYIGRKKWQFWQLWIILILLILAFLTYNAMMIIAIVIWCFLPWFFWQKGKSFYLPLMSVLLLAIIPCALILAPVTKSKNSVTIFSEVVIHHQFIDYRQSFSGWKLRVLGNRYVFMSKLLLENTLASFSPKFWWRGGDHPWHQLPGHNHLTLTTMILIYVALIKLLILVLIKLKNWSSWWQSAEFKWLVLLGLTLIPSVITIDAPHATRSLAFFYLLMIVAAVMLVKNIQWRKYQWLMVILLVLIFLESINYFYHYVTVLKNKNIYQYGISQLLGDDKRPTLIINDERQYQYIKLAWESKMPAEIFWSTIVREKPYPAGIIPVSDLANYHFFDYGVDLWPNWQVVRYNIEKQRWERQDD